MTDNIETTTQPERAIQLEKFFSQRETERWCKRLSAEYPAAEYWLCHESRILQGFQRDQHHAARFIAVDLDRRILVSEAKGHPLTHWLATPVGELEHPFQRSSDLVRLVLAGLRALLHLSRAGLVHGGLRPDVIVLSQNDRHEIDFDSFTVMDFGVARSLQNRIEKPLLIDLASPDASYLAPSLRDAIQRDWQTYAKLSGESGKSSWYELSETARHQYDSVLMPDLAVNTTDWRVDLYALGHWFKQISLHRIDYYKDAHQELLPSLIKKMQKPVLQGGFTSLEACIKAFEALEIDERKLVITEPPHTGNVYSMQPTPVLHPLQTNLSAAGTVMNDEFSPGPINLPKRSVKMANGSGRGKFVGIGIGLIVVAGVATTLFSSVDPHPVSTAVVSRHEAPAANAVGMSAMPSATDAGNTMVTDKPASAGFDSTHINQAATVTTDLSSMATAAIDDVRKAAEKGDAVAQTQMGLRYRKGQGVPADNVQAVEWYRKAAAQNHAEGQAYLGFMYMTGRGIKRDDAEAVKYSRLAADQGNAIGQYNLALLYLAGRGVNVDNLEAYKWLKKAAKQDSAAKARLSDVKRLLTPAQLAAADTAP